MSRFAHWFRKSSRAGPSRAYKSPDTPQPVRFASVDQVLVRAQSTKTIPLAIRQITALLHDRHHIRPGQLDDFHVRDMTEMTKAMAAVQGTGKSVNAIAKESGVAQAVL